LHSGADNSHQRVGRAASRERQYHRYGARWVRLAGCWSSSVYVEADDHHKRRKKLLADHRLVSNCKLPATSHEKSIHELLAQNPLSKKKTSLDPESAFCH
jgi:hypothetical protein